ncbi:nitrate- and nitrite sensing domain-containing protein [Nitrincola sp. MINF-07-Sa-05]|uniref:nitrate- and nitrite sensing domain-containing protein n=1 Tax=Nitrincola salilacus TaxID=3400273 RepID=UPI0039180C62
MMPDSTVLILTLLLLITATVLLLLLRWHLQSRTLKRQKQGVRLLTLLRELIADLQRHRGLSTGLLRGDKSLSSDLQQVRTRINTRLQLKSELNNNFRNESSNEFSAFLKDNERWLGITDHWSRLGRDTHHVTPDNNLQQHNRMIGNLIFLAEDVAESLHLPDKNRLLSYQPYIWREVIQAAEWAGQARALGTGIAAAGQSSAQERIRLRFLRDKIQALSDTAFTMLRHKSPDNNLFNLLAPEAAVCSLLLCIEQELLRSEKTAIAAKSYFAQATLTIDALFTLVDTALEHLNHELSSH